MSAAGVNLVLAMSSIRSLVSTPLSSGIVPNENSTCHVEEDVRTFLLGECKQACVGGHRALGNRQLLE
jgi:hypothetical protein